MKNNLRLPAPSPGYADGPGFWKPLAPPTSDSRNPRDDPSEEWNSMPARPSTRILPRFSMRVTVRPSHEGACIKLFHASSRLIARLSRSTNAELLSTQVSLQNLTCWPPFLHLRAPFMGGDEGAPASDETDPIRPIGDERSLQGVARPPSIARTGYAFSNWALLSGAPARARSPPELDCN